MGLLEDMSSSDEEIDDTYNDKDYVPTQQQQKLLEDLDDLPIDVNIFLNNNYLVEDELINEEVSNLNTGPNISGELNVVN